MNLTPHDIAMSLNSPLKCADYFMCLCPWHDDHNRSLQVGPGYGFYCHGCGMSGHLGIIAEHLGIMPTEHEYYGRLPVNNSHTYTKDSYWGEVEAFYTYKDESECPLYDVVRLSPKSFRIRRYCYWGGELLGRVWGLGNRRRVWYHLPEIIGRPDETVIIVEGEKDADRLYRLGLLVTTCAGGVGQWLSIGTSALRGRRVVILPDEDLAGIDGAGTLRSRLTTVATSCHICRLGGLGRGGDVSDWLDQGHTKKELLCLLSST